MSRIRAISTYNYLLIISLFIMTVASDDTVLNVNLKKPIAVVSERFLSITLDPVSLFNSNSLSNIGKTTNMAKALAPAYVRIGGPRSNSYIFERGLYPEEVHLDPGYTFPETHWIQLQKWGQRSGLDIITCLALQQSENNSNGNNARSSVWDPRNALNLISFSDHMGFNTSWQLGYECQTRCDVSGAELGRDVQRLRNMLDAFPRYAERGMIVGPDAVTYKTKQQQQYLQNYFNAASGSLSAITWHPDFASISLEDDGVSMHYDNLAMDKDSFYRVVGRHIAKKPLWIAEARPEECKQQFLGALVWARRLGNSAKLGFQVLMRQPENSDLFKPTPDYWVSILHKMLVGREVLDTKIATGNRTHVHFYCHCTNPFSKYEKGSLTIFGINLTPSKITVSIKGIKLKIVHKYILLPGYDAVNRMFSETVLLNNEPLNLIDGIEVPDLKPLISSAEKGMKLKLPSGGIGFWVLPGLKIKACMSHDDEVIEKNIGRKINRRIEESEVDGESNSVDDNNREITDVNSIEEKRPSLRLQRTTQKRLKLRRNIRHKEDETDDLDERKSRKVDRTRHDFDRLEKIMRKKDQHSVNLKSVGTHGVFENYDEDDDGGSEEDIITRTVNEQKLDSSEVIRAKLQEYKNLLSDYENKKKQLELISNLTKERTKDEHDDSMKKNLDTDKVIEALTLITKVESAMKGLEKENENDAQIISATATLGSSDFNDVTAGLQRINNSSQRSDDVLLDEVLKTEKSKRTSIPSRIEDQLKALYHLLSEEKERKDRSSQRRRRDLDNHPDVVPLRFRHDNIFIRKRIKPEEVKERLIDRINARKQRLRERQELKREKQELKKEHQDKNENNFYDFQNQEPLKIFPKGDVYFQTAIHSNERKNIDYDYIYNADGKKPIHQRRNWKRSNALKNIHQDKDTSADERGEDNLMANEFYENVKLQKFNIKENLKDYGELWKAESSKKNGNPEKYNNPTESTNHKIITESSVPNSESIEGKENAVQQLLNYYETDINEKDYNINELKQNQQQIQLEISPATIISNNKQITTEMANDKYIEQPNRYTNIDRYYISPHNSIQADKSSYHRTKRYLNDLEDLLHQEMITQDDNNLKDCQCRVIRGIEECKDCDINQKSNLGTHVISIPYQMAENYMPNNFGKLIRLRRDLNEKIGSDYVERMTYTPLIQRIEIMSTKRQIDEPMYDINNISNIENCNKTTENVLSTTINIQNQLELESDNNGVLNNRLPRKIEPSTKIIIKTGESFTTPSIKVNSQNTSSTIYTPKNNETESVDHVTNIRSISIEKKVIEPKVIENYNITEEKRIQNISDQTTIISITNNSTEIQKVNNTKSINLNSKKTNATNADPKIKPKNSTAIKIDQLIKSRQARLTTRAEALAALRKENESRRAKKMIEASMKIIDLEKSKFAEYQKRRHDQIERLKRKLLVKREKMLQQYRNELLEVINESSESKESNIHKRDTNDMITAPNKDNCIITDKHTKYNTETDVYKYENEIHVPTFNTLKSYNTINNEQVLLKPQHDTYVDVNSRQYSRSTSDEQVSKIKNRKRYPYSFIERSTDIKKHELENFNDIQENSNSNIQSEQKYFPHSEEIGIPLHIQYSQQPVNIQQAHFKVYQTNPSYIQEKLNKPLYRGNPINVNQMDDFQLYDTREKNIQESLNGNNFYKINDQFTPNNRQFEKNINHLNELNHENIHKKPLDQNYQKSKRSNPNVFKNDPSMYEDYGSDYISDKLLIKSSCQFASKNYGNNPYKYMNERHKRDAIIKNEKDLYEPLSFSLGLEKSKMITKKLPNIAILENLIGKKQLDNKLFNTKNESAFQNKPLFQKNIKKAHEKDYIKKTKKLLRNPEYMKSTNQISEFSSNSIQEETEKITDNLDTLSKNVKRFNINSYLSEINNIGLPRNKRSLDQNYDYHIIESNGIDRLKNPEIENIWNSVNEDEKLLQKYNRINNDLIQNIIETQNNVTHYVEPTTQSLAHERNLTIQKNIEITTQTNIELILVDAIPKLQTVITGGLQKTENLTSSLQNFIDNFDNQTNNIMQKSEDNSEHLDSTEINNESLSHNIFKTMVGSVRKFFGLVSGIAKIFHVN